MPQSHKDHARGYEGIHLEQEGTPFNSIHIALKGTLVRYSLLKEPDYYWVGREDPELKIKKAKECITMPWATHKKLVSLGFLLSHTRIFDMTREFETVGTTEILTGSKNWKTGVFQCRNSHTFSLDARFVDMISDKSSSLFFRNAARVSITTWAQRCRRQQEILTRAAKGKMAKELALEYLDEVAGIIRSFDPAPDCYNSEANSITFDGNIDRLSYYIGVRPSSLDAAWDDLRGKPRTGKAETVLEFRKDRSYILDLERLREARGSSKFANPIDLDITD